MEDARRNGEFNKYLDLTSKYRFNASGRFNHEFFFDSLLPIAKGGGSPTPKTKLRTMIEDTWGSVEDFIKAYCDFSVSIPGSGFGWLVYNSQTKNLELR